MPEATDILLFSHDVNREFDEDQWECEAYRTVRDKDLTPIESDLYYDEEWNSMNLAIECVKREA